MIDIHSHTTYSDGSFSVKELLNEAERIGLSLLSITDYNTIDAYYEIKDSNIRNIFSGNIISGTEITTTYKGETIEVLGYGFELEKMKHFLNSNVLTFEEKQIKEYELDGLECFYTTFTEEQSNYLINLCKERHMYRSGGSDFHGTRKVNHNLGIGHDNLSIDETIIKSWINKYIPNFNELKNKKKTKS